MGDTPTPDPNASAGTPVGEPTDEELETLLAQLVEADAAAGAGEPVGAQLSAEERRALELSQAQAAQTQVELAGMRRELDEAKFEKERLEMLRKGIPPASVELARPLLTGSVVVELSGGSVDAGAIVRQILEQQEGQIDLSGEHGGNYPVNTNQAATAVEDALYKQLEAMTGGK